MELTEKRIGGELKYKGVIVNVYLDEAELVNGKIVKREVVAHPGGVGILPIDSEGYCYLVRQFRYPAESTLLEIPAGKLEYKEDHRECAVRELSEETGFCADELIYMGGFFSSPGFSTEKIHLYLARGLHKGEMHPDEDEFLNLEKYSISELLRLLDEGKLSDAKTAMALLCAQRYL